MFDLSLLCFCGILLSRLSIVCYMGSTIVGYGWCGASFRSYFGTRHTLPPELCQELPTQTSVHAEESGSPPVYFERYLPGLFVLNMKVVVYDRDGFM